MKCFSFFLTLIFSPNSHSSINFSLLFQSHLSSQTVHPVTCVGFFKEFDLLFIPPLSDIVSLCSIENMYDLCSKKYVLCFWPVAFLLFQVPLFTYRQTFFSVKLILDHHSTYISIIIAFGVLRTSCNVVDPVLREEIYWEIIDFPLILISTIVRKQRMLVHSVLCNYLKTDFAYEGCLRCVLTAL